MKKIISILIIVTLIFSLTGCIPTATTSGGQEVSTLTKIQQNKKVVIGTAPGYYPFEMKDTDGNWKSDSRIIRYRSRI